MEKNDSKENLLLLEFTNIYLNASKSLQNISVWSDEKKEEWQNLFETTLRDLKVIYGYFVEYEPRLKQVEYFIKSDSISEAPVTNNFKPPYIPYFESALGENSALYDLLNKGKKRFTSIWNSPKLYQHLPIQHTRDQASTRNFELISDKCLNCYIPYNIRLENDYYVVLFDEIVFYQFAYYHLTADSIYNHYSDKRLLLTYLLKFALSIELRLGGQDLSNLLELTATDKEMWEFDANKKAKNELPENLVRNKIEEKVKEKISETEDIEWVNKIDVATRKLIDLMLKKYTAATVYDEDDVEIEDELHQKKRMLEHLSRFDIPASFCIVDNYGKPIFHDLFVFPIYTETKPVFRTECINGLEQKIHSPILLVLYIKTLYKITTDKGEVGIFDENNSSVDGFQMTKEISKLFAEKVIQEEYLENVLKLKIEPAIERAQKLEAERDQQSREIMLQVALAHYIKNSMAGLAYNESRVLDYIKEHSADENVKLYSELQLAIYDLITLYLQIRQDAQAGLLMPTEETSEENNPEDKVYQISFKDFVLMTYSHCLILKNGLGKILENIIKGMSSIIDAESLSGLVNAIRINIAETTNCFKMDFPLPSDFNFTKIVEKIALHSKAYNLNLPDDFDYYKLNVNKREFKMLYTTFNEVFENIYSGKNMAGKCTFMFDKEDPQLFFLISHNYPLTKDDIQGVKANEYTEIDPLSKGKGLKIINQSLKDIGGTFRHSPHVIEKEVKDPVTLNTENFSKYFYQIRLENKIISYEKV